ncbi:hypothetical protein MMC09_002830 [Bachmanniomyces sp. S44760]|nr:hypothetical protein [Bachmanniomyces sp. S44760]
MEEIYSFDYYTESWIEVSSRPSSSSLSSAATDEIVTTGLHVQQGRGNRRRRPHPQRSTDIDNPTRPASAASSSQEEYEESESESDRIMSSSTEDLHPRPLNVSPPVRTSSEDEDDDDGDSTALGVRNDEPVFTPQPNAFSHPPASDNARETRLGVPHSYFPDQRSAPTRPTSQRHSYPSQRARSHTPFSMMSPSYQTDHDAALRASLSTLLSCAAAARGLPKRERQTIAEGNSNRIEPSTLRMVPESVVMGEETRVAHGAIRRRPSQSSSDALSYQAKGKRKASSRDRRETKKSRRTGVNEVLISPTLMTWVVSAGVVVLFSAISFSAGYAYGREVGRMDAGIVSGDEGMACGKEMGKSLRRLRWGTSSSVVRV